MKSLEFIKGVDIYLLDQCMKGGLTKKMKILDAGFGKGRNFKFLYNQGYDIKGIEVNQELVQLLSEELNLEEEILFHSSIEDFSSNDKFDYIICNAVLHFAKNHHHFDTMFNQLISLLNPKGTLFIRMTSNIGFNCDLTKIKIGVYTIPDGTTRYLITQEKIEQLISDYSLKLIEPIKTVNVDNLRFMTTLVFSKQ